MELAKQLWSDDLKNIRPEVKSLFCKGNVDLLLDESPRLAVVGSRRMTDYGERIISQWVPQLVDRGVTIVSGFMYGVDQSAHRTCLESGGKTIAILGWGIDWLVAGQDRDLYRKILEADSLIMSEYGEAVAPQLWFFPQRNRIVAGICDAVLVVEGSEKSGSMITARLANRMGKKLLAVPGRTFDGMSQGTNKLIQDGKAKLVMCAEDVLREMGLAAGQMKLGIEVEDDPILLCLADCERSGDEVCRLLKMESGQLLGRMTEFILQGKVVEVGGKYRLS